MTIEAALSCGPQDAGEYVLGDGAARRPVASAVHFPCDDRPADRVFSAPVKCRAYCYAQLSGGGRHIRNLCRETAGACRRRYSA